MKENYFENEFVKIWIENEIVFCTYKENTVFTFELVKFAVEERLKLTSGKNYPMFVDVTELKYATKRARSYLKSKGTEDITAGAFLINSSIVEIICNYFIKFDKPPVPTRLFTDKNKAIQWLQQFKIQTI